MVHMTSTTTAASLSASHGAADTVLTGVPVVPGVAYAPVIRPGRLPLLGDLTALPGVADRVLEAASDDLWPAAFDWLEETLGPRG